MKAKFVLKIIISLLLMIIAINVFLPVFTLALDQNEYFDPGQFDHGYDNWSNAQLGTKTAGKMTQDLLGRILTIIRVIALGWGIIMAISIAIKYFTGSAQIKSQLKTDLPTYIIGAVLLFGAAGLITLIQVFVDDFFPAK